MSLRPLVFLLGLTLGDYLLWHWSLNGNHDVLALVSGLTLPPLGVACIWLIALSLARLLAGYTRVRAGGRSAAGRLVATRTNAQNETSGSPRGAAQAGQPSGSSRKLAA